MSASLHRWPLAMPAPGSKSRKISFARRGFCLPSHGFSASASRLLALEWLRDRVRLGELNAELNSALARKESLEEAWLAAADEV